MVKLIDGLGFPLQQQGSDSDLSLAGDHRGSKQNIKGRLSGMFRRSVSVSNSRGSIEKISTDAKPVAVQTICTDALPATTQPPPSPNPSKLKTTRTVVRYSRLDSPDEPPCSLIDLDSIAGEQQASYSKFDADHGHT